MPVFDLSGTPKKEEESQYTYTVCCSGEAAASPEKLMLILDNSDRDWKHHSYDVFTDQTEWMAFEFKEGDGVVGADILRVDIRFISLLRWLGKNHISVRLSGQDRGDGYAVYKIRKVAFGSGTKFSVEDGFLQFMTDRLLASSVPEIRLAGEDLEKIGDDMELTGLQSLSDFINRAGRTLPNNVRIWARWNLAAARSHEVTPEKRRRAQCALSITTNTQWKNRYLESIDPREAQRILDGELYGTERVKRRIIETITQINRIHALPAYDILLVDLVDAEKSQITYAVTRVLEPPWTILDMSFANDPEQLTGSSRIYSSAEPGTTVETFSMARKSNLVFIVNELDEASTGRGNGNPTDMLPTLLGNLGFTNNYMECMIPTDGVYPIVTANDKSQINVLPISRLAVVDIPDYTLGEKRIIFFRYAMPKVLRRMRLRENECVVTEEALDAVIEKYTDITGTRDLKQAAERMTASALYQIEVGHIPAVVFDGNMVQGSLGQELLLFWRVYRGLTIKAAGYVADTRIATWGRYFMNRQGEQRGCNTCYTTDYASPVGGIKLAVSGEGLVGLWLEKQKYFADIVKEKTTEGREPGIPEHTKDQLDHYFTGEEPVPSELLLAPLGGEFRQGVWEILCQIPYDQFATYGGIVERVAMRIGREIMSTQAVDGAVSHDPVSIITPCRRVTDTTGSLTGYAGGIDKKTWLLRYGSADMEGLFMPRRGTTL